MSKPFVLTVIGTRPEAIKMLPVVRALRAAGVPLRLVATGQHRELLGQAFAAFDEQPDRDLGLMTEGQTPTDVATRAMPAIAGLIEAERPALMLVHGDTTTAMAAALAAFHAGVLIGHVEAGLRSHDLARPFPEEFNRVAIDTVASLLLAPTAGAAANLRRESPRDRTIVVTGNTGIDALLHVAGRLDGGELARAGLAPDPAKRLILVTGHRRESFGPGFERICAALARLAARGDVEILYPVHLNPNVREPVAARLGGHPNIRLVPPVGYVEMVALMQAAAVVLTDSGGVQEEAPAIGKPVLVMREVTERPEAVALGAARLVGTDPDVIVREVAALLDDAAEYAARSKPVFPYGDGRAAPRIAAAVVEFLAGRGDTPVDFWQIGAGGRSQ
ncbi:non-hydrolyzing UDP-N-acetylglucosamine 2-epimerase [Sphingosinicella sp.]|uniref:non-hydrolyzing UDP-N-acetylglucosamine 2-epimerase n=1 Tax=Sphingosinicella sp. TaxID=1917971 RepID=UPI0040377AE7